MARDHGSPPSAGGDTRTLHLDTSLDPGCPSLSFTTNLLFVEGESPLPTHENSLKILHMRLSPSLRYPWTAFLRIIGWDFGFPCHTHTREESIWEFLAWSIAAISFAFWA
jgi:hypothetical protein